MTKTQNTKVKLPDGRTVTLTPAQVKALQQLATNKYARFNIRLDTARALKRKGLVTLTFTEQWISRYVGGGVWKSRLQVDHEARPVFGPDAAKEN